MSSNELEGPMHTVKQIHGRMRRRRNMHGRGKMEVHLQQTSFGVQRFGLAGASPGIHSPHLTTSWTRLTHSHITSQQRLYFQNGKNVSLTCTVLLNSFQMHQSDTADQLDSSVASFKFLVKSRPIVCLLKPPPTV